MPIRSFRSTAGLVSVVLEDGTLLFSKSMHKSDIEDLFLVANNVKEMSDENIIGLFYKTNKDALSPEEKKVIAEREYAKKLSDNLNEYKHLFNYKEGAYYRRNIPLSIPESVFKMYTDALIYSGELSIEFKSVDNFWMWCSMNPNKYAREELLSFLERGGFMITPNGYFVAYRGVHVKEALDEELTKFVSKEYTRLKSSNRNPEDYNIIRTGTGYQSQRYDIPLLDESLGNLLEKYMRLSEEGTVYTDAHTHKMRIKIGREVRIPRSECDESSENDCSRGLHLGNVNFGVQSFGKTILICLCNPMNVVAVPKYNADKLRTCAYYPMAVVEQVGEGFEPFDYTMFDSDYFTADVEQLYDVIKNNNPEELKIHNITAPGMLEQILTNLTDIKKVVDDRFEADQFYSGEQRW